MLQALNTRTVANAGLVGGGLSIVGAIIYFFNVLRDPAELVALYVATKTHADPTGAVAKLVGAGVGIIGAIVVSLVAAYVGRPSTIAKPPAADAGKGPQ